LSNDQTGSSSKHWSHIDLRRVTKVTNSESEQGDMTMNQNDAVAPDRAQFPDLEQDFKPREAMKDLDFILDIPLEVSVELGRTKMLINELLQLGQGSVIELNKLAGEPLEILINRKLVARGEAVVVNEKFGVRLTDIISPMERVKQLG
jgi:flagellar motor switch protein FliN